MSGVIKNRIYVGRLPDRTRESDLERFLRGYGDIKEIRMMTGYAFVEFDEERDAEDAVYELNGKSINGESVAVDYATVPRMTRRNRSPGYSAPRRRDDNYDDQRYGGNYGRGRDGPSFQRRRPESSSSSRSERYDDRNRRPVGGEGYYGPLQKSPFRVIVKNLSVAVSWQDLKDFMRKAGDVTFTSAHQENRNEGVAEFGDKESMERAIEELDGSEIHGMKIRLHRAAKDDRDESGSSRSRSRSPKRSKRRSRSKSPAKKRRSPSPADSDRSGRRSRSRS